VKDPDLNERAAAGAPPPNWTEGDAVNEPEPLTVGVADFFGSCRDEIEWLLKPFIVRGGFTAVIGAPKSGKTWLVAWFAAAAAAANLKVIFVEEEGAREVLRDRLAPFLQPDPSKFNDALRIAYRKGIRLDDEKSLRRLIDACRNVDLLVLDPWVALHGQDENEQSQIGRVLQAIQRIISETGCAVVLVHHTRKGDSWNKNSKKPVSSADARGSGSLAGAADQLIAVRPLPLSSVRPGEVRFWVENSDTRIGEPFKTRLAVVRLANGVGTMTWEQQDGEGTNEKPQELLDRALPLVPHESQTITREHLRKKLRVGKARLAAALELGFSCRPPLLKELPHKGICRPFADPDPDCDSDAESASTAETVRGRTGPLQGSVSPRVRQGRLSWTAPSATLSRCSSALEIQ